MEKIIYYLYKTLNVIFFLIGVIATSLFIEKNINNESIVMLIRLISVLIYVALYEISKGYKPKKDK